MSFGVPHLALFLSRTTATPSLPAVARSRCALLTTFVGELNRNYAENHSARDFPKSFNVLRFAPNLNDFA